MASGLDDYQTKPIDWAELDAAILRNLPWAAADTTTAQARSPAAEHRQESPTPQAREEAAQIDAAGVARVRDELGLDVWKAVAEIYWPQSATDLAACRAAVMTQDAAALRSAAHSLKGASSSLGFETIASLAAALERCEPTLAGAAMARLESAYEQSRTTWSLTASVTH